MTSHHLVGRDRWRLLFLLVSARRLDYCSRSWIMQEYELLLRRRYSRRWELWKLQMFVEVAFEVTKCCVGDALISLPLVLWLSIRQELPKHTGRCHMLSLSRLLTIATRKSHTVGACTLQANVRRCLVTVIEANRGSAFSTSRVPLRERHPEAPSPRRVDDRIPGEKRSVPAHRVGEVRYRTAGATSLYVATLNIWNKARRGPILFRGSSHQHWGASLLWN
ncbi:hypothetical protein DFH29DRAFT_880759 [Suillus ampliporus]|nr:hypothetical protein DFH29DRAFT_880759 [Suillus ampliporus]